MTQFDVATLNRAQLAALYNSAATKPVKSFSTHTLAVERVLKLAAELNLTPRADADGNAYYEDTEHAPGTPVDVTECMSADEYTAHVEATTPGTAAEPAAAEPVVQSDVPPPPATKASVLKAKQAAARVAKAPKPAATGVKRGPAPKVPDDYVFLTVAANPKRAGAANHARYALYEVGMTVGAFLDAAHALQGASRGRWRGDVAWDVDYGFITVGPAADLKG